MLNPNFNLKDISFTINEQKRYARHLTLPLVIIEGQKRLKLSKILFVGAGGLASSGLLYLAASGIGTLGIVDNDKVELSNLQRQIIYSTQSIKVESSCKTITKLNPNCKVNTYNTQLDQFNAQDIIKLYDIVIDSTDNIKSRSIVDKICGSLNKPYGTMLISVLNYQNGPRYFDLNQNLNQDNINNCKNNGVIGLMKILVTLFKKRSKIKELITIEELLVYNALDVHFTKIKIMPTIQKDFLSRRLKNKEIFSNLNDNVKIQSDTYKYNNEYANKFNLIIDIRTNYEFLKNKNQNDYNSINIPLDVLFNDQNIDFLKRESINKKILIYCETQSRSKLAVNLLNKYNIKADLVNL
uniref:Molybdopterin biosynthesis protein n=1 Tax=Flintiella sanguinaria TaxID=101926 RepID=A0A1X9PUE8_9RHOD|nr:molybdopterin biosynthesis protein [Flintiella sanguinaria]